MDYCSWEFSNWKKSSASTFTKFRSSYIMMGLRVKVILCGIKREEKNCRRKYLLISGKCSQITRILANSDTKSADKIVYNFVSIMEFTMTGKA